MGATEAETKTRIEAAYKSRANPAVIARVAVLQGGASNTAAGSTEDIDDSDI